MALTNTTTTTTTTNTAFVLVPGGLSPPSFYERLIPLLTAQGHEAEAVDLPSVGQRDEGPATMHEDAAHVRASVLKFLDQGKNVVIGMNSYGGIPGTEATKDLSAAERAKTGKNNGIVGLAYIAAVAARVGKSLNETLAEEDVPNQVQGDYVNIDLDKAIPAVFNDMSEEDGREYAARFRPHSAISFGDPLTHPGYKDVPVTYVMAAADRTISPAKQAEMIAYLESQGVRVSKHVLEGAGHTPMLSQPHQVADILLGLV